MPQGFCNAFETFQGATQNILADLKLSFVLVYFNDIKMFRKTFNEHIGHLMKAFKRLINNNMKLKLLKYNFLKNN